MDRSAGRVGGRDAARGLRLKPPVERAIAEALEGRYTIVRELARGGMATVYLAHRVAGGAAVAIKVMHPALAAELGAARFLREIEIVASMAHPLIVPLDDSGAAGDLLYYVMPYVEGETLHQRLGREPRLPLDVAVGITRDVAAALGYAHDRGVLHRDVKPENILLAGGKALVADFGLARAIGAADTAKLTRTGMILGTIFYMSPEQIREDRRLDQRADIYSLGGILYEMLTGAPPYTGGSLREIVTLSLKAPIPSVRRVRPDVPPAVDEIIGRALAKHATERFPTMKALEEALAETA